MLCDVVRILLWTDRLTHKNNLVKFNVDPSTRFSRKGFRDLVMNMQVD